MLIEQHLLERPPGSSSCRHRPSLAPPFVEAVRSPTILSARVAGTTFRPTPTYTTLRDVTHAPARWSHRSDTRMAQPDVIPLEDRQPDHRTSPTTQSKQQASNEHWPLAPAPRRLKALTLGRCGRA